MGDFFERLEVKTPEANIDVGGYDISITKLANKPQTEVNELEKKKKKEQRNRRLFYLAFAGLVGYFAYVSFIKK